MSYEDDEYEKDPRFVRNVPGEVPKEAVHQEAFAIGFVVGCLVITLVRYSYFM